MDRTPHSSDAVTVLRNLASSGDASAATVLGFVDAPQKPGLPRFAIGRQPVRPPTDEEATAAAMESAKRRAVRVDDNRNEGKRLRALRTLEQLRLSDPCGIGSTVEMVLGKRQ